MRSSVLSMRGMVHHEQQRRSDMGQARQRGTREQRIEGAKQRQAMEAERQRYSRPRATRRPSLLLAIVAALAAKEE